MGKTARWLKALFGLKSSTKIRGSGAGFVHHTVTDVSLAKVASFNPQAKLEDGNAQIVRLNMTSKGRNCAGSQRRAAIRIQTNFRGYLARKALRALKGVVKIQAIVRGYLVRKRANATIRAMQVLFRLQSKRAVNGADIDLDWAMTLHWARPSKDGFGDAAETEKYYKGQPSSGKSRRLSLPSSEAKVMDLPKVIEVDKGPFGSRLGQGRPGPNQSCSGLRECRPPNLHSTSGSGGPDQEIAHVGWGKEEELYYYYHPNYMNKTMSFKAKMRAQSAPKQRPEPLNNGKRNSVSNGRKRMTLSEVLMETRNSACEVGMQRSFPINLI